MPYVVPYIVNNDIIFIFREENSYSEVESVSSSREISTSEEILNQAVAV